MLLYPIQHLTSIPTSSSIYLHNAEWLISQLLQAVTLLIGLLQFTALLLHPISLTLASLSLHALFCGLSILSRAMDLHHLYKTTQRSLAKMEFVYNTFSVPLRTKEEEWTCGICFEGDGHRNKRRCLLRCAHVCPSSLCLTRSEYIIGPACRLPLQVGHV